MPEASGRGPLAAEAEPFARDVIHDRPVDQVRLDNGGDPAQKERGGQAELLGRGDRDEAAQNDDCDLDVQLGPDRFPAAIRPGWERRFAITSPTSKATDVAALVGEFQRPADPELLQVGRRRNGQVSRSCRRSSSDMRSRTPP